jgi:hypothetical protein
VRWNRKGELMTDPFEGEWIKVREPAPAYSYIKLHNGFKSVAHTREFGPQVMYYDAEGKEAGVGCGTQVLLDFAEDGTVLGIEILVPGTLVYDKRREEETG